MASDNENESRANAEQARKRFVSLTMEAIWEHARIIREQLANLRDEAGMETIEIIELVCHPEVVGTLPALLARRFPTQLAYVLDVSSSLAANDGNPADAIASMFGSIGNGSGELGDPSRPAMYHVIQRLFADAPKMTDGSGKVDEEQAPAVQCHVMLFGSMQALYGALSETPEGALRMLTIGTFQEDRNAAPRQTLLESFFDYKDVVSVMVEREVKPQSRSSILMG